jgi:hypothetical protein
MEPTRRLAIISYNLEQALANDEEMVLFGDIQTGRFVQIAVSVTDQTLIIDIPLSNLSSLESQWLAHNMDAVTDSGGNPISYQKIIPTNQTDYAAECIEWIFTKIFRLPETFRVTTKKFT